MTKLEELKAAFEAATPGEWTAPGFNSQGGKVACLLDDPDDVRTFDNMVCENCGEDSNNITIEVEVPDDFDIYTDKFDLEKLK